ncbi:unnamed protein product, partial [Rotaria socialis]
GFLFTGLSSSESLLLELAAFFITGVGADLVTASIGFVFFLSSSDDESDDESFFFEIRAVACANTTGFLAGGAKATRK